MDESDQPNPPVARHSTLAERWTCPLIIVGVWLAFYSRVLVAGHVFFYRDLFFFHEPLRRYWTNLVSSGHAPFLNAALNLGEPILANPNNAVFYPGNILYVLLPFELAWNLSLAGHVLWAALGVYWLARHLGCARFAALCGALVFGFCGPIASSLNYYNLLVAASWIPWVAGCALMAWRRGGTWIAATSLALAAQILSGEPTIVILTAGLLVGGYVVGVFRDRSRLRAVLLRGAGIALVAPLLASIQILPTLLWLPHSGRGQGLPFRESAAWWSLHPFRLAELLVPQVYGNPLARLATNFWGGGLSDSGLPYIMKLYAGLIPLLLLPLALRRLVGRWAVAVFVLALALSLGHHLVGYHQLYEWIAPFRLIRYPEKFTILAAFALAVATALALDDDRHSKVLLLTSTAALLALLPILAYALPHEALHDVQRAEQLRAVGQAAVVLLVSACVLLLESTARFRRIALGLIPAVIVLDVATATWDIAVTRSSAEENEIPALLEKLPDASSRSVVHLGEQQADAYFRAERDPFLSMHDALHPFTGLRWGVTYGAVDDIDRMGWKFASERQRLIHQVLLSGLEPSAALSMMQACGINRVISLAPLTIAGLHEESVLSLPSGPVLHVYGTDLGAFPLARFETGEGSLAWNEDAPHHVTLSVDSTEESTIVVARNALPGWSANRDGRKVALAATAEGLIRLSVPPGHRPVVLSYSPPGLMTGTMLSIAGLVALAAWSLVSRPRATLTHDRHDPNHGEGQADR